MVNIQAHLRTVYLHDFHYPLTGKDAQDLAVALVNMVFRESSTVNGRRCGGKESYDLSSWSSLQQEVLRIVVKYVLPLIIPSNTILVQLR